MLIRIHVNQHKIRRREDKPITVKSYRDNRPANSVKIIHQGVCVARVVYRPDDPLTCGARVWIETQADVELD
jgi:hypothetical protein